MTIMIVIVIIRSRSMSTKFGTKRTNAGDVQKLDTTNIQKTDREKTGRPGDRDKQVMLMQSKMKLSARLTKNHAMGDLH